MEKGTGKKANAKSYSSEALYENPRSVDSTPTKKSYRDVPLHDLEYEVRFVFASSEEKRNRHLTVPTTNGSITTNLQSLALANSPSDI